MSKPEVVLRVSTKGHKVGDTIEVADSETADALVAAGQARRVSGSPTQSKASEKD